MAGKCAKAARRGGATRAFGRLQECPTWLSRCLPVDFCAAVRVWDELNKTYPTEMSHYVQNVGAGDGVGADPLYSLISQRGIGGVAIEPEKEPFLSLQKNMAPFGGVTLINEAISPSNAETLLAYHPSPGRSIDIFKNSNQNRY